MTPSPCWEAKVKGDPSTSHMEIHMTSPPPYFLAGPPWYLNNERSIMRRFLKVVVGYSKIVKGSLKVAKRLFRNVLSNRLGTQKIWLQKKSS